MAAMPREPRFRILMAVVLTAAIGAMFLAGEGRKQAGVSVSSTAGRQLVQNGAPVATAPSSDQILTYTGRDPFAQDQPNEKKPEAPNAGPAPVTSLLAPGLTSALTTVAVPVSAGGAGSTSSPRSSTNVGPVARTDPKDVVGIAPKPAPEPAPAPSPAPTSDDPATVDPAPVYGDGSPGDYESPELAVHPAKHGKPAKRSHSEVPRYQGYERTKEEPARGRRLQKRTWRQAPGRRVGQMRTGRRGNGFAWGWRKKECKHESHSQFGCRW